ncbi:MAG TPA: FAD-binding oxidoreductase [Thermoleophilaceae bacterium]|nr:FAD-binding oxidoreductase [Thermoleophilaceae bacterium]
MISAADPAIGAAIYELSLRLAGDLHEPGSPGYEDACSLFNSMVARRPRLVARCTAPDDVVAGLAFARDHDMRVTVRAGGHSVTGASLCDDGLVLDVRGMADVEVDAERRIARIGGGATWAAVDRATQAHGLATTGGRVSSTGVVGLTAGGGSGWLERKHGLACDSLVAVELVTADGRFVRASEDENPELLWAHRGGGANFGVVTALELALHPVGPEVLAGLLLHPAERGPEVLRLYRDTMRDAPDGLSLALLYLTGPDEPEIPAELRGRPVVAVGGMYAGSIEEGEAALREIRAFGPPAADFFAPTPYAEFQCSLDDPPGYRNYWTVEHLDDLPAPAIDAIHERSRRIPPGPAQLFIAAWGGAVARNASGSVVAGRDARFVVHPLFLWEDPADDAAMIELGRGYRELLAPWATGAAYSNFLGDEGEDRARAAFAPGAYERLAAIKAEWDPGDVFLATGHVPPAAR